MWTLPYPWRRVWLQSISKIPCHSEEAFLATEESRILALEILRYAQDDILRRVLIDFQLRDLRAGGAGIGRDVQAYIAPARASKGDRHGIAAWGEGIGCGAHDR